MVARTVEYLKEEQIGNICLFADSDGKLSHGTTDRAYSRGAFYLNIFTSHPV